jgi:hypothetical protein
MKLLAIAHLEISPFVKVEREYIPPSSSALPVELLKPTHLGLVFFAQETAPALEG